MEIEQRLASLKSGVEAAQQKKLRAEMEAESAMRSRNEALDALKSEFGVDSPEEAEVELEKLRDQLQTEIEKAEEILRDIT